VPRLHDVGTLGPGSGQRLVDRNPDDRHGVTSHLTPAEIDALEPFLLSLE
jgi:hypothetical protein